MAYKSKKKRMRSKGNKISPTSWKMQKRAAASSKFKFKSVFLADNSTMVEAKQLVVVDDELEALNLTTGDDYSRPNRRLTDFLFHDADGKALPVETLEVDNIFISGLILPLEETSNRKKQTWVLCEGFGRAESWAISGYDDGLPIIWVSTKIADYHCVKPAAIYEDLYGLLFAKAKASIEIYKRLSKSTGGNPDLSLEDLINGIVPLMSCNNKFPPGESIRQLIISWGRFIYDQLIGLDETSCKYDEIFSELPALVALRDESERNEKCLHANKISSGRVPSTKFRIGDGGGSPESGTSSSPAEEGMEKHGTLGKSNIAVSDAKADLDIVMTTKLTQKCMRSNSIESSSAFRNMPKSEAGCADLNFESVLFADKFGMFESREQSALSLTAGEDYPRPNRRLTDFIFHDADGKPQPVENLEVENIYISGLILPLEETTDKEKVMEVPCEEFGRVESWAISGYEDGLPVIWVSTKLADYDCLRPADSYKPIYDLLLGKAHACLDIYTKLSKSTGGNPDMNLESLLSGVVSSLGDVISFPPGVSIRDLIISWGRFLYHELIGLDATSSKDDLILSELPVLAALRDESERKANCLPTKISSSTGLPCTSLRICGGQRITQSNLDFRGANKLQQKRTRSKSTLGTQKKLKREAACTDFEFESVFLADRSVMAEASKVHAVDEELAAISLTVGEDYPRPNRRLTDFVFHDLDGKMHPIEMLEEENIYISGLILPLESFEKEKLTGARCQEFGRIESWAISGYEDGLPVIWVSTKIADYDCIKPAASYKMMYDLLLGKAVACLEIYKRLSKSTGGNPEISLEELLGGFVGSVSSIMKFPPGVSIRDLIISWGRFIYSELIGLDSTCCDDDVRFSELPVLAALRDASKKDTDFLFAKMTTSTELKTTNLRNGNGEKITDSNTEMTKNVSYANADLDIGGATKFKQTGMRSKRIRNTPDCQELPKQEVAHADVKYKSICMEDKAGMVDASRPQIVKDELAAIDFTAGEDYERPNRRLTDFIFHDADGKPQPVEMLEVDNIYISGLILPLEETFDEKKLTVVRCKEFGRVESWAISGYDYEDGLPVIWVSTKYADYDCVDPAASYQMMFNLLLVKAHACLEVYKVLSKPTGGNPDMSLDELVGGVVCSLRGIMNFPLGLSIRDLIISWGRFVYNELIGLDTTSSKDDVIFSESPVLASLRDESDRNADCSPTKMISSAELTSLNLRTVHGQKIIQASTSKIQHVLEKPNTVKSNNAGSYAKADFDIRVAVKPKREWMRSKRTRNAPDSDDSVMVRARESQVVEDELAALSLTEGQDYKRSNRRLTDFIFHDANGKPQPVEMLEVENLYVSGLILPLEGNSYKEKVRGVRCKGFGRVESWAISGYEDGIPVLWVSTMIADYDCVKPAANYQTMYGLLLGKARACVEIYKMLSKSTGGNPDMSFHELIGGVVRSMRGIMNILPRVSIRDLIITWGRFICDELIGLDATSSNGEVIFSELQVLAALRNESERIADCYSGKTITSTELPPNGDGEKSTESSTSTFLRDKGKQVKLISLLKEKVIWRSLIQKKRRLPISPSYKFYTKINKDDIANEYPVPSYHITTVPETDECIIYGDADTNDPDLVPQRMLHNWSLYNSELVLISLELLPMKACEDINVSAYGSGFVSHRSRFCLNAESRDSSGAQSVEGTPICFNAIKEWKIEVESSTIIISVRTNMAWYRLGEPSKQYAPWYEPVLKTARLAVEIIKLLKGQSRVSRMSFQDVIKRMSRINKDHPAYLSSNPFILRRYMIVHGPVILQHFAQYPDDTIKKCAFLTCLGDEVDKRCHTKWLVKKKINLTKETKFIRIAAKTPAVSKRKVMPATTTRMIDRIWGEYYSNYSSQELMKENGHCEKNDKEKRKKEREVGEKDKILSLKEISKPCLASKYTKRLSSNTRIVWLGEVVGKTCEGDHLYQRAIVRGDVVAVGGSVLVEAHGSEEYSPICFVEYMFENSDARKLIHGRLMLRGCQTVLGNTANEWEVFLTNDCVEFELGDVKQTVFIKTRCLPWGYQHRKSNAKHDRIDRENAEDRKNRGLSLEYVCKSLYWPERGAFFCLQTELMGLGSGVCSSCKMMESMSEKDAFKLNTSMPSFTYQGVEYQVNDFMYVGPRHFFKDKMDRGLKAYVICQLLVIKVPRASKRADPTCVKVKVRRFFRPEDISAEKAYHSDIREVYYSKQEATLPIVALKGKCEVRRAQDLSSAYGTYIFDHIFICEHTYDLKSGALNELPIGIKLSHSKKDSAKGKGKSDNVDGIVKQEHVATTNFLATLDIFAGCGGLSEGLQQSGVSTTKWAIEYDEAAAEAFKFNHSNAFTSVNNCNVILRAIMTAGGNADDCISISEDAELAAKLSENELNNLPQPGQVDFIIGGPPCQGFSGLNRYNQSKWSKVQCEMIPVFLSFVDYFRPKFFLLENVRNFVSFNNGQVFRLTLSSLLEMGYQVKFGILEAGAYGVSQSRKRAFIWAVSPLEALPEWPEPMYVFAGPELKVTLDGATKYAAVRSTASGAPFRAVTVKDAIGDLPTVGNGASLTAMEYKNAPVSWFQKSIRGDMLYLTDHISKEMNESNLIRCQRIPKRPGADWRDLPDEKVRLSCGKEVKLVLGFLKNTAMRHNQWKGLLGRLDWEGNFPTSITDPQPMGIVGKCFHPEHDRILSVREYARAQGFRDSYNFSGKIQHKHRQIGNAVPPPLAFALGRKLKEAVEGNHSTEVTN